MQLARRWPILVFLPAILLAVAPPSLAEESANPAQPRAEASGDAVDTLRADHYSLSSGRDRITTSGKFSTGVASDFQLTLGGEFSDGLAQQNGFTVDVKNVLRENSTLRFTAWNTFDTKDGGNDWISSINYIQPLKRWESGGLSLNLGVHRWQFPSVLSGGTDYIADSGLIWNQQTGPIGFTLDANVKTLAGAQTRNGAGGQIYYFRGTTAHPLRRTGKLNLALVHGPSFTYANRFYGCRGARVFRYEAGLSLNYGRFSVDTLFRPQLALQGRIPEHNFWSAGISYVLW
ncbi:MAG: hypothetical protein IT170_05425 [Bryobacterales bacterium]|nr:hypothetical protein [Bryobacterales bacterium]